MNEQKANQIDPHSPIGRRARTLRTLALASVCALAQAIANATILAKPDALLQIDMNRSAVVERIVSAWSKELPASQENAFKAKLMGLRADQLLAANVSGSFDGVLEVMDSHEKAAARLLANQASSAAFALTSEASDKSKALGDASVDLLYTPVVPCRVFDTRTPGSPFVANGLTSGVTRTFDIDGANLSAQGGSATGCGIPTSAKAIVLAVSPISPPVTGWFLGDSNTAAPLPASTIFNYSSNLTLSTFTVVLPMVGQAGGDIRLEARGVSAYSMDAVGDVSGYFSAATAVNGNLLTASYRLPQACANGQVPKFNTSTTNWECANQPVGTVTNIATGAGLSGGPITGTGTISLAATQLLPTIVCASSQYPQWSGSAWVCSAGTSGAQGPVGPAGPAGPQGPTGPAGASAGTKLVDANSVVLGTITDTTTRTVTIITSTGHIATLNWTGTFPSAQIYYTGATCTGSAFLNSGSSSASGIYKKTLVFSGSLNALMVPANSAAVDGTVASVLNAGIQAIDNPTCGASTNATNFSWQLATVARATVGLPATIAAPLVIQ